MPLRGIHKKHQKVSNSDPFWSAVHLALGGARCSGGDESSQRRSSGRGKFRTLVHFAPLGGRHDVMPHCSVIRQARQAKERRFHEEDAMREQTGHDRKSVLAPGVVRTQTPEAMYE